MPHTRPAQASLTLRPAGLLNRLKRPLSRGSSPAGYPAEPLVSYQINRQLSGWNLPPLVIRAFGAHCQEETSCAPFKSAAAGVVLSTSCRRGLPKPCLFSGSAHAIGRHRILNQSPLFSGAVSTRARMRSRVWTLGTEGGAG